jgi:hypothetical protein
LQGGAANVTAGGLLALARQMLGPDTELEIARDMLEKLVCPHCHAEEMMYVSLGKVKADQAPCPNCGTRREVATFFKIRGNEPFLHRTLAEIGVPPFDILIARGGGQSIGFELSGDAAAVLGPLV